LIDRHLTAFPARPDGYVALGEWYRRNPTEGNAANAAQEAYRKALELDATFAPAHREIALLCLDQGDTKCARRHLLTYVELAPAALDRPIAIKMLRELEGGTP
jgi:tetratricopeptide (TPR) repeat protein